MPRFKRAKCTDLTEHHARIMYDRVADEMGAPCEWLEADDFDFGMPELGARHWFSATGGQTHCACVIRPFTSEGSARGGMFVCHSCGDTGRVLNKDW